MRAKAILLMVIAVAMLSYRSDGQAARPLAEQLKLASVMPRSAMLYLQARDLSALMKTWLASGVRQKFYDSASFKEFTESRIYLKLQSRRQDMETAIGVGLDEDRLAELAGGTSAVALYDIGNLELVFVTEVARERAIATLLFKQMPQFQERSAEGSPYYLREVTTDNGNLKQQFCFAYANGKMIVTTTEGLMLRALANSRQSGADSLLAEVTATVEKAEGFGTTDLTMWLDQTRLNASRHFKSYWIHKGTHAELAKIESGILDLRFTPQGMSERRWFVMKESANDAALSAEQANGLMKMTTSDAQLIELRALGTNHQELGQRVAQAFFGKLPAEASLTNDGNADYADFDANEESTPRERYRHLDGRFDSDVDDEQAVGKATAAAARKEAGEKEKREAAASFEKSFSAAIAGASPIGYAELVRSRTEAGRPFVRFERALVIEMKSALPDHAAFERAVMEEMRARFIVAGIDPGLQWQDDAGVRFVAQSLLEQGAAYAVSGKYLVLSSSREFVRAVLQAASATTPTPRVEGSTQYFALVRVANAKPVFDKLMKTLDGKSGVTVAPNPDEESQAEVKFFSDNLSSFIAASAFREMRLRRESAGRVLSERIAYLW